MEFLHNIIEYYDELYPVSKDRKTFYSSLLNTYSMPAKLLSIGCGTGSFDHYVANMGHDVTGIDTSHDMLETANRRRRLPNTAIRFFQMSSIEMSRFLCKNFYDILSCLNDKIIFIHDNTLLKKFFFDSHSLLRKNGTLVLQFSNFCEIDQQKNITLTPRESIRATLISKITEEAGKYFLFQNIDKGNNKHIPVLEKTEILPITPDMVQAYAAEAGFSSIEFFDNFSKAEFSGNSNSIIAVIKK